MGVMESAVALRSTDADEVADVFQSFMRSLGHPVEVHYEFDPSTSQLTGHDVLVAPARDGWVHLRPHYVVPPEALAVEMTLRLGTLASAIMIYEDVLWSHHLVDRGTELDRHVNIPEYFGAGEYDESWLGDADVVAEAVGVDRAVIAPYFQQVSVRRARSRLRRRRRRTPTTSTTWSTGGSSPSCGAGWGSTGRAGRTSSSGCRSARRGPRSSPSGPVPSARARRAVG